MMIKKVSYFLIVLLLFCYSQNNKSNPVDSQLEKLIKAIHTRDTAYIYQHLFNDVQTGFDADGMGVASFRDRWNLTTTSAEEWEELHRIVKSGWRLVIYEGDSLLEFPSIKTLCEKEPESIEQNFVLYNNTPVLNSPNGDTLMISKPVLCKYIKTVNEWVYAQFSDGKKGYIHSNNKYNCAYDLRMYLKKDKDEWKIESLLAGD